MSVKEESQPASDHHAATPFEAMDRMYRYQKYIYNLTRKYYLFGRDTLLERMSLPFEAKVLEVGCGTARNLIRLSANRADLRLFGLDASAEMLTVAQHGISKKGLAERITLRRALAEDLDPKRTFGLDEPFDVVFFSYSLSMIPTWSEALAAALAALKTGGRLYLVDFWDLDDWPGWIRKAMQVYLSWFGVVHRPEFLQYLSDRAETGQGQFQLSGLGRRYALLAEFQKRNEVASGLSERR